MVEKEHIAGALEVLNAFEQNNPKIFQRDRSVRFPATVIWEVGNESPLKEDDYYVRWDRRDDTPTCVTIESADGKDGWEPFWRLYADVAHYYLYDPDRNVLVVKDVRGYMEVTIEPEISVRELLEIQKHTS